MKKRVLMALFVLILIPGIFAFPVKVTIKTQPGYLGDIRALNHISGKKIPGLEFTNQAADSSGLIKVNFNTTQIYIKLSVIVRTQGGALEKMKVFKNIESGNSVYIDMTYSDPEPVIEPISVVPTATETEENKTANETSNKTSNKTSNNTEQENIPETTQNQLQEQTNNDQPSKTPSQQGFSFKSLIYLGVVIFTFIFLFMVVLILKKKNSLKKPAKIVKMSEKISTKKTDMERLSEAEEKIRKAQEEINEIKNRKGKIKDAEKKLEADKLELKLLKEEAEKKASQYTAKETSAKETSAKETSAKE
ncbi:hypothetical protein GF386_06310, partial [Candidatus Pacearchaeota archaeon]|nr:hypothetical protein [Candidatus Pacearchaeota archaeon]MBD3283702.1 hypothetical protein [Candidatus Pacearchaeota archaeon]